MHLSRSKKSRAARVASQSILRRACSAERLEDRTLFSAAYAILGATGNTLVKFDTANPTAIQNTLTISGLQSGELIQGIDFRPSTGVLYGLGVVNPDAGTDTCRLYTINTSTGVATQVGAPIGGLADGSPLGFDFNPAADRIRVFNAADQNFRLHPDTGSLAGTDTNLDNPLSGETVVGGAYDRNDKDPATPTTLFGIDSTDETLVLIGSVDGTPNSPNGGVVTALGFLSVPVTTNVGFDIDTTGVGYVAATSETTGLTGLYTIVLSGPSAGQMTLVGLINNGADAIRGFSVNTDSVANAPNVSNDTYSTTKGVALNVAAPGVLGNDSDPNSDPITVGSFTQPANGTVAVNANGGFVYTPNAGFVGTDTFTYKANDGSLNSPSATVTITVAPPNLLAYGTVGSTTIVKFLINTPGTIVDTLSVSGLFAGESIQGLDFRPATGELFALGVVNTPGPTSIGRLYRIDKNTGVATRVSSPTGFTIALADNASYGFDFNHNVDRIRIVNDVDQNLRVNPNNGALVQFDTTLDNTSSQESVVAVAYDRNDNNTTTPTTLYGIDAGDDTLVIIGSVDGTPNSPNGGVVTALGFLSQAVDPTVGFDIVQDGRAFATFTTTSNGQTGLYTVNLTTAATTLVGAVGNGSSPVGSLAIALENAGPVSNDDSYVTTRNAPLSVSASGVLANDTDADGNSLTVGSFTQPANGTVSVNANGSFTYTPNTGFTGTDSFTYRANDGTSNSFNPATVTISVANTAPVAVDDNLSVPQDGSLTVSAPGVLGNDTDSDGDPLTVFSFSGTSHGNVVVNLDGSLSYTPDPGYSGPDSFTYKAYDGDVASNLATVNITVQPETPSLSVHDVSITEGNAGTKLMTFGIDLSAVSASPVTVQYSTANQTAFSGSDFVAKGGTITIAPGQWSAQVSVTINGETKFEGTETLRLVLFNAVNATIADDTGVGTIQNDDAPPVLSITNVSATEGQSGTKIFQFKVTLSQASMLPATVKYATSNGTASSASDYTAAGGTLTFAAGETTKFINITVKGDTTKENNETFFVTLSNPANATLGAAFKGTGTITNDD